MQGVVVRPRGWPVRNGNALSGGRSRRAFPVGAIISQSARRVAELRAAPPRETIVHQANEILWGDNVEKGIAGKSHDHHSSTQLSVPALATPREATGGLAWIRSNIRKLRDLRGLLEDVSRLQIEWLEAVAPVRLACQAAVWRLMSAEAVEARRAYRVASRAPLSWTRLDELEGKSLAAHARALPIPDLRTHGAFEAYGLVAYQASLQETLSDALPLIESGGFPEIVADCFARLTSGIAQMRASLERRLKRLGKKRRKSPRVQVPRAGVRPETRRCVLGGLSMFHSRNGWDRPGNPQQILRWCSTAVRARNTVERAVILLFGSWEEYEAACLSGRIKALLRQLR